MSNTFKHKVRHIFYDENGKINLKVPFKLRWSYIRKVWRHNFDYDIDRALLVNRKDKINKADMKHQIKDLRND